MEELHESIPLVPREQERAELFCDARGYPARIAAVLCVHAEIFYTAWDVPDDVLATFCPREDQQIMGLELMAVVFGLHTFLPRIQGLKVCVV